MNAATALLDGIRSNYQNIVDSMQDALAHNSDPFIWQQLSDGLEEFSRIVDEHSEVLPHAELEVLKQNILLMRTDIQLEYQTAVESSHHGRPELVYTDYTGSVGRPPIAINSEFLQFASGRRTRSGLARYFGVSRSTILRRQRELGIYNPQTTSSGPAATPSVRAESPVRSEVSLAGGDNPFVDATGYDELLDPVAPLPEIVEPVPQPVDGGPLSDDILDILLLRLRSHFRRAGVSMLEGMLARLGHDIPRERIRKSLKRIDPVHRVFQRIQIRRRGYHVPGPNSLWHHDGQHGLIRWGIVIHGFIDGYSRMITGLRASNNNSGQTVLNLFLAAAGVYGVPSRLRGDHGIENILVAALMEELRGNGRGSYIWGRSVHNVRIERLWVDITAQIGATWREEFTLLEASFGLNHNNFCHRWLLHHLFLPAINAQLSFFAESWNAHKIQMRRHSSEPNRSPEDMFVFDMFIHGVRGDALPDDALTPEELEVYGIDWDGLTQDDILDSLRARQGSGWTSWIGQSGPPADLGGVALDAPEVPFDDVSGVTGLDSALQAWVASQSLLEIEPVISDMWVFALSHMRGEYPDLF